MHSIVLSDNRDSLIGMRMAGIDGFFIKNKEEAWEKIMESVKNPDIGILFITEKIADMVQEQLIEFREKTVFPLITIIPDRHGFRSPNKITKVIREAIGM